MPYEENFVQYRAVANLTLSETMNDVTTPYTTLPMVFASGNAQQFLIPRDALNDGTYYEFRLGYPFPTYTFYTNTMIAKTFDVNSPFVNSLASTSLDTIVSVSWNAPEYGNELIEYAVSIYYSQLGNAGINDPQWGASGATLVTSFQLPLTQLSFTYGCTDLAAKDCLAPYTTYLISIAVIRTSGTDEPKAFYVSTQQTITSLHNSSSIYLYALTITMNFTVTVPQYAANTPINATLLHPLSLHTTRGDLSINLTQSTVFSVSNSSIRVTLSLDEYKSIVSTFYEPSFLFTPFVLQYGTSRTTEPSSVYCLSHVRHDADT